LEIWDIHPCALVLVFSGRFDAKAVGVLAADLAPPDLEAGDVDGDQEEAVVSRKCPDSDSEHTDTVNVIR
jgi:hypothetical protein